MHYLRHFVNLKSSTSKAATAYFLGGTSKFQSPSPWSHSSHIRNHGSMNMVTKSIQRRRSYSAIPKLHSHQVPKPLTEIFETAFDHGNGMLKVTWNCGTSDSYPYIWLRDNCQCPECFHVSSQSRIMLLKDLQLSVFPVSISLYSSTSMEITWSDGHKSLYPSEWLHIRSFEEDRRKQRLEFIEPKRTHWGAKVAHSLPKESFQRVIEYDEALLRVLQQLEEYGLVILQGAPTRNDQVRTFTDRIGFIHRSYYGEVLSVKSKVNAENVAYTNRSLDFHVDYSYHDSKPGIQMFHCIGQTKSKGGETLFVDGFHVANQLRHLNPDKFNILATTPVSFKDAGVKENGKEVESISRVPLISLDQTGSVKSIVSGNFSRDSFFSVPIEKVKPWYAAMSAFHHLLTQQENVFAYKMDEGDVVIFDNTRVLHGRNSYEADNSSRELETCYLDWDQARSRRRVLQSKLAEL